MNAEQLLETVDADLLRQQRLWLLRHSGDEAEGLIALTDAIADYLADVPDRKECLLTETGGLQPPPRLANTKPISADTDLQVRGGGADA